MKTYYIAPRMRKWESLSLQLFGLEGTEEMTRIGSPEGCPGCMLVFESMERLLEVYPDVDPKEVLTLQSQDP